jgi:hypothetical protein
MLLNPAIFRNNPVHKGSKELYERIGTWHDFPIPFTKEFGWERWGLLGLLIDFALHYTRGDIIEIGIGESSLYFTRLARKYNRKVYHCDRQKSDYENLCTVPDFFDESNLLHVGTSDDFFKEIKFTKIAVGFIDGDHMHKQVEKDFNNLFNLLVDNGYIFFHDLHPPDELNTAENRSGDGYIFRKKLEKRGDLDIFTFPTSAWNAGLTIVRKIPKNAPYYQESGRK